jgi:hypothetical protein
MPELTLKDKQMRAVVEVAIEEAIELQETVSVTLFGLVATAFFNRDSMWVETVRVDKA